MVQYTDGRQTKSGRSHPNCFGIIMTDRAFAQIYCETQYRDNKETGGLLLGHFIHNMWFIIESSDPGYNCIFHPTYHINNEEYANHVCTVLSRLYKHPLSFLGMWHRHTGSNNSFSTVDNATNTKYAKSVGNGCISLIINQDPLFRITAYYVDICGTCISYTQTDLAIGNQYLGRCDVLEIAAQCDIDKRKLS